MKKFRQETLRGCPDSLRNTFRMSAPRESGQHGLLNFRPGRFGGGDAHSEEVPAQDSDPITGIFPPPPQSVRTFHGSGRAGSAGGLNASESRLTALPGLFMTLGTPGFCAQAPDGGCRIGDSQPGEGRRQLMSGLTGKKPAAAPRLTRRDLPPEESYGSGSR